MAAGNVGREIGTLFLCIIEGVRPRIIFNTKIGSVFGRVIKSDQRLEAEFGGLRVEVHERDTIAKNIVDPTDLSRLGAHLKTTRQQPLIEAVARPEHHLVKAGPHWVLVTVDRRMLDGEKGHMLQALVVLQALQTRL